MAFDYAKMQKRQSFSEILLNEAREAMVDDPDDRTLEYIYNDIIDDVVQGIQEYNQQRKDKGTGRKDDKTKIEKCHKLQKKFKNKFDDALKRFKSRFVGKVKVYLAYNSNKDNYLLVNVAENIVAYREKIDNDINYAICESFLKSKFFGKNDSEEAFQKNLNYANEMIFTKMDLYFLPDYYDDNTVWKEAMKNKMKHFLKTLDDLRQRLQTDDLKF